MNDKTNLIKPNDTIPTMEALLNNFNNASPKTQTIKENINKIKQQIRQQKELNKISAMTLEQNNYSHLVIFSSDQGFCKIAGNSVLFYAGNVAKRIGRRFSLQKDNDYYAYSETGIISIRYNEVFEQKLLSISLKKNISLSTPHIYVFDFPQPFTKNDISQFQNQLRQEQQYINKIILPASPIPTLFAYLRDLNEIIYYNCKNAEMFSRDTIGRELMLVSEKMLVRYLEIANNEEDKLSNLLKISKGAIYIKNQMKIAELCHMFPNRNICRILEITVAINRLVTKIYQTEKRR